MKYCFKCHCNFCHLWRENSNNWKQIISIKSESWKSREFDLVKHKSACECCILTIFLKLTFGINFIYRKQAGHLTSKGSGSCFKKYSFRLAQNSRCSPFCHRFTVVHNLHMGHLIFRRCLATANPIHPQTKQTLNEKAEVIKVTQRMKSMGSLLSALADIVHKSNLDGFRFIPYCFWWSLPLSTLRGFLKYTYFDGLWLFVSQKRCP